MFMEVVHVDNDIPEENEEKNVRNDVHILNHVYIDGNSQKRKTPEISTSHFKTGRKKSSMQIGEAARLSSQIEKLCNAVDNMSQATSSLTPDMDPYGIPQAIKMLDYMSEEDCIGAIDDTHIVTILPPNEQIPDIGRKGVPTQNVMTMCDFNVFHIYYGWMGRTGT
ncbi:hypothetical protein Gohar_021850 [Gossypium harknessii]|uniref:Uncharacterized protein n=1 Tax=Gossypium harknessii TaxID=34285 RepID=A0A7J9I7I4_9ROSI|nr:hypothetical protein [Gossypium harknessii]